MKGKFTVRIGKDLHTVYNYNDIPEEFDNVIEFLPDEIPEPHSEEDHELLESFVPKLKELMKKEKR